MIKFLSVVVVVASALGCAVTQGNSTCRDYQPIILPCQAGTVSECRQTSDGCEQCSCVPTDRNGLAPRYDDRR